MKKLSRTIDFTRDAEKFIRELLGKQCGQVCKKILGLSEAPEPNDSKTLKGEEYKKAGLIRVDVGEYRIIYRYDVSRVEGLLVGNRNDGRVYKNMKDKQL
ncbi:hypothetical protein JCM15519_10720 [Fundidesulfovibrio butyratiphilus]